jgi:hypothetical protein
MHLNALECTVVLENIQTNTSALWWTSRKIKEYIQSKQQTGEIVSCCSNLFCYHFITLSKVLLLKKSLLIAAALELPFHP